MRTSLVIGLALAGLLAASLNAAAATGTGTATIGDDKAKADKVAVTITGVSPPAPGTAYEGWLVSDDGSVKTSTGILRVGSDGRVNLNYASPTGENLFGRYNKFVVTVEPVPDRDPAPSEVVAFKDELPPGVILHVRHLQHQWDDAPKKTPLAAGVWSQAYIMRDHAGYLIDEARANNITRMTLHAEHLVNIIDGKKGKNYGDANRNGVVDDVGDGYGLLVYAELAGVHAGLAAGAPGAGALTKLHATHVQASTDNIRAWTPRVRDVALQIAQAPSVAAALPLLNELELLAKATVFGIDANGNGNIELIKGEAGAVITYVHTQYQGIYSLAGDGTPPPATVPSVLPKTGDSPLPILAAFLALLATAAIGTGLLLRRRTA